MSWATEPEERERDLNRTATILAAADRHIKRLGEINAQLARRIDELEAEKKHGDVSN